MDTKKEEDSIDPAQFDFMMQLNQTATFENVFDVQLTSMLAEFLPVDIIFTKFCVLNMNFN
jgi:hypothetical protein